MAAKGRLQSRQQRKTLLAQGGQIATNAAKSLGTSKTPKTSRNLLLHLDHPEISLCKVVVKIHAKVLQEAESRFLMFAQAIEQIACRALFAFAPGSWRSTGPWSRLIALMQQAEELRFPVRHFHRMQPVPSLGTCLLGRLLHIKKQALELLCPDGPLLFCQEHQLPENMHQTCGVLTVVEGGRV
jgi:hypothetical protein